MKEMIAELQERIVQEQALAEVVHNLGGEMRVVSDTTTVTFPANSYEGDRESIAKTVRDTAEGLSKITLVIEFLED